MGSASGAPQDAHGGRTVPGAGTIAHGLSLPLVALVPSMRRSRSPPVRSRRTASRTGSRPRALEIFRPARAITCTTRSRWCWPACCSRAARLAFQAGIVVFCGSLYALALTDVKVLGAVTPIGGLAFLAAWLWLAFGALRRQAAARP